MLFNLNTMSISNSRLYYKVTNSSRQEYNFGSMQQVVKNSLFYNNYKENFGNGIFQR